MIIHHIITDLGSHYRDETDVIMAEIREMWARILGADAVT